METTHTVQFWVPEVQPKPLKETLQEPLNKSLAKRDPACDAEAGARQAERAG